MFIYTIHILWTEATQYQGYCLVGRVFCDQGPFQSRPREVPYPGIQLQFVTHHSLCWNGLQPFLHQAILHAVCEQTLRPVPPSHSS
ncbi:hypothetical protein J4Q44_G00273880 [Coregonus suidteri]|uniref:Uncharacterized protein n=1 Tax=Coregonus suidteri TaxID=861788 RepID=A0AAN8QM87_9TELE